MKKKILRLFICFLAAISCFLFNNDIVKADDEIEIDSNGTPGSGGKDPCDPWSYVCIYNYAAFKVTYYPTNGNPKSKIYYTDKYKKNPFTSRNLKKTADRKKFPETKGTTAQKINFQEMGLGNVSKSFTSVAAQGMYEKLWNKMTNLNSKLVNEIFSDLTDVNGDIAGFVKNHKNDYFFVEPLYQVKIQKWQDAQNAVHTKQGKFKSYFGTTYGVAHQVSVESFNECKNSGVSECNEIYYSRKEKYHVSRIANSLRLEKTAKVGKVELKAGTPKAKKGTTKMNDLVSDKGYGIGAIKLRSYPVPDEPPEDQNSGTCYSYFEKKSPASCEKETDSYQTEIEEVTVGESTPNAQSCTDYTSNSDGSYQSQSIYGKKTNIPVEGNIVGDYCAIYCTKNIKFSTDIGKIVGAKEISPLPNIANSSTTYTQNLKIEKEVKYTCHADVTKYYGADKPTDDWFTSLIGNNYAQAYYKIEEIKKQYDTAQALNSSDSNIDAYKDEEAEIIRELYLCAYYEVFKSEFENSTESSLKIKIGNTEKELTANNLINRENEFVSPKKTSPFNSWHDILWDGSSNFGEHIKNVEQLVNDIINQGYTYYTSSNIYSLKSTSKYGLDLKQKDSIDNKKEYGNVADDNINDNSVCKIKQKLKDNGQTENTAKISIVGHDNLVCTENDDKTIEYSPNIVAECPANTYHAGTNAYYWLANSLINDDSLKKKALGGVNSTEAIDMFCNNKTLEKFDGGYEQIINEDGSAVLDDCLMAGVPLKQCQENAGKTYNCTDGQGIKTDVSYFVYLKAKEKSIDFSNITQMNTILKSIEKENPYCNDSCYNGDKNSKTFVYRTISLGDKKTSFPGKNGNGRTPGSNWNSDSLIEKIITNRQDVYNNEPMYEIFLDYSTLKKIRSDNKQIKYDYGNFNNLECNENGTACISKFLREKISVSGRCSRLGKENFYTNCN
jgi:hypothetical protein